MAATHLFRLSPTRLKACSRYGHTRTPDRKCSASNFTRPLSERGFHRQLRIGTGVPMKAASNPPPSTSGAQSRQGSLPWTGSSECATGIEQGQWPDFSRVHSSPFHRSSQSSSKIHGPSCPTWTFPQSGCSASCGHARGSM